jgi:hypothetical protein
MKIVKTGWWLYDGTAERPVDIVGLGFDFWYELVPCHPTFALRGARGRSANVATDT